MSSSAPDSNLNLLGALRDLEKLKHQTVTGGGLDPRMAILRTWQSARLTNTYADLLDDQRYKPACLFFLEELYAPRDFSQRDHDIEQMYSFVQRIFPEAMIRPLRLTVEVHRLTNVLDAQLLEVLVTQLAMTTTLTEAQYAEAYRRCDNYVERVKQIDQIYKIGYLLEEIMQNPLTGAALALAKTPARKAGWDELTTFMEKGYEAFRRMRDTEHFLKTIRQREKKILDQIYAESPHPFVI